MYKTKKILSFIKLMRADKPIGTALLLWPTLSAFFILTNGDPNLVLIFLFMLGTFLMRSAGCVINDYFDRDFDGKVERTKNRPMITGEIRPSEALSLFTLLILLSASLLFFMNLLTTYMAMVGLALATIYPLSKRFFSMPQVFLGLAFSWGIIMVSAAETNNINNISLLLFFSCFFWIIAYDTAYALCDKKDDLNLGINSSAITFGSIVVPLFFLFHLTSILILVYAAVLLNLHISFYPFVLISFLLAIYQTYLIKDQISSQCLKAFKNNNWLGLSIFLGSILGVSL
tara:strand:- start:688 stop:1548 length:861 start_codon:yes stop_codon:yes gene_type:complete